MRGSKSIWLYLVSFFFHKEKMPFEIKDYVKCCIMVIFYCFSIFEKIKTSEKYFSQFLTPPSWNTYSPNIVAVSDFKKIKIPSPFNLVFKDHDKISRALLLGNRTVIVGWIQLWNSIHISEQVYFQKFNFYSIDSTYECFISISWKCK